jgi:hypothetical protein
MKPENNQTQHEKMNDRLAQKSLRLLIVGFRKLLLRRARFEKHCPYSFLIIVLNKNGCKRICEARSRPFFIPDY